MRHRSTRPPAGRGADREKLSVAGNDEAIAEAPQTVTTIRS